MASARAAMPFLAAFAWAMLAHGLVAAGLVISYGHDQHVADLLVVAAAPVAGLALWGARREGLATGGVPVRGLGHRLGRGPRLNVRRRGGRPRDVRRAERPEGSLHRPLRRGDRRRRQLRVRGLRGRRRRAGAPRLSMAIERASGRDGRAGARARRLDASRVSVARDRRLDGAPAGRRRAAARPPSRTPRARSARRTRSRTHDKSTSTRTLRSISFSRPPRTRSRGRRAGRSSSRCCWARGSCARRRSVEAGGLRCRTC